MAVSSSGGVGLFRRHCQRRACRPDLCLYRSVNVTVTAGERLKARLCLGEAGPTRTSTKPNTSSPRPGIVPESSKPADAGPKGWPFGGRSLAQPSLVWIKSSCPTGGQP